MDHRFSSAIVDNLCSTRWQQRLTSLTAQQMCPNPRKSVPINYCHPTERTNAHIIMPSLFVVCRRPTHKKQPPAVRQVSFSVSSFCFHYRQIYSVPLPNKGCACFVSDVLLRPGLIVVVVVVAASAHGCAMFIVTEQTLRTVGQIDDRVRVEWQILCTFTTHQHEFRATSRTGIVLDASASQYWAQEMRMCSRRWTTLIVCVCWFDVYTRTYVR